MKTRFSLTKNAGLFDTSRSSDKAWLSAFRAANLDTKLIVALVAVALIGFMGMAAALSVTIIPSFTALEERDAEQHRERADAVVDEFARRVESSARDYGAWNDSYLYVAAPNAAFEQDTLSAMTITNLDMNAIAYVRFDGQVIFSRWVDSKKGVEVQTMARELEQVFDDRRIRDAAQAQDSLHFFTRIGDHLAAVGVAKVVKTDGSGQPLGFVVMARQFPEADLSELLGLKSRIVFASKSADAGTLITSKSRKIEVPVHGFDSQPVANTVFSIPRSLSGIGNKTLLIALVASVFVMFLVLIALGRLVTHFAVLPLRRVERHMQRITESGELRPIPAPANSDEIGSLIRNFNIMLSQLIDLREQLEVKSFKLGKTESAVGLMHNVRNGLNPVSIILTQVAERAPPITKHLLSLSISELREEGTAESRRDRLLIFLGSSILAMEEQLSESSADLLAAKAHLDRVIRLIGEQQAMAHERVELSFCDVLSVVAQNADIARHSVASDIHFEMPEQSVEAMANRVLLSQVIGNLFTNAAESIVAAGRKRGAIEVTFDQTTINDQAGVRIVVRDNGEGFSTGQSKIFFEQGYSTRKNKVGGLGLHWCSHAIGLMEGTLSLQSSGAGLGAEAVITLRAAVDSTKVDNASSDKVELGPIPNNDVELPVREIRNHR